VAECPIDTKLIAASQTDLSASVSEGCFRADQYHRLAVVVLTLPPVREPGDDILGLARHFLRHYGEVHRLPPKGLSRSAEAWLLRYDWSDNVRELSHLMERVTLLSPETMLAPESLERLCLPRLGVPQSPESGSIGGETDLLDEATRIRQALVQAEGNVMRAARLFPEREYTSKHALTHEVAYGSLPQELRRNVEILHGALLRERFGTTNVQSVVSRAQVARCLAELGAFAEGRTYAEEALRLAVTVEHPYSLIWACNGVGHFFLRQGALSQALHVFERALSLPEAGNFPAITRNVEVTAPWGERLAPRSWELPGHHS
jgi:hypothetical protein